MLTLVLLLIVLLIAIPFAFQTIQIRRLTLQLKKKQKIRLTLSSRIVENLAESINSTIKDQVDSQIDIKRREEKLKQSIAHISHDLRTPLTSIQGYLTLLKDCNAEEKERYLQIIEAKANSLNVLVHDFYYLSILDDPHFRIKTEPVDIVSIITETIISNYTLFNEKNIIPKVDLPTEQMLIVGEKSACQRIILNLVSNAIRYSTGTVNIHLSTSTNGSIFTIRNSVKEINEHELSSFFDRFYTSDRSRSKGGTGLGLYIVKTLLEKIGGNTHDVSLVNNEIYISIEFISYKK